MNNGTTIPNQVIVDLSDYVKNTLKELSTNNKYPTIDIAALLSIAFELPVVVEGHYSYSSIEEEVQYLYCEIITHMDDEMLDTYVISDIMRHLEVIIRYVWQTLEKYGVMINAKLPYEFDQLLNSETIVLRKRKNSKA